MNIAIITDVTFVADSYTTLLSYIILAFRRNDTSTHTQAIPTRGFLCRVEYLHYCKASYFEYFTFVLLCSFSLLHLSFSDIALSDM